MRSWSLDCFVENSWFVLSRRIGFQFKFTRGFIMMFNPPTHRDTDFKTPDTEFYALVLGSVFFSSGISLWALLWLLETIYFRPNCSQLIISWVALDEICRFLCLKPIKHTILIVPFSILIVVLFCGDFLVSSV